MKVITKDKAGHSFKTNNGNQEMSEIKITDQDVGRKFRSNGGVIYEVVEWYEFEGKGCIKTRACDNNCGLNGLADNGKYHRNGGGHFSDFKEWINEDIYKSVNTKELTEADIGREFLTRDGSKCKVVYFSIGNSPVAIKVISWVKGVSVKTRSPYYFFTTLGQYLHNREPHHLDFKEWADEDEKMENKIKLKVGQKVEFRDGEQGIITSGRHDFIRQAYIFVVKRLSNNSISTCSSEGRYCEEKETEDDIIKVLEEPKEEKMEEVKDKFELNVTVNDVNNSGKNDKYYFNEFTELSLKVRKVTFNKICLTKFVSEQEVFENKGDALKLSKVININGKELGKVTIRITKLED